jgi:hypothetical protein
MNKTMLALAIGVLTILAGEPRPHMSGAMTFIPRAEAQSSDRSFLVKLSSGALYSRSPGGSIHSTRGAGQESKTQNASISPIPAGLPLERGQVRAGNDHQRAGCSKPSNNVMGGVNCVSAWAFLEVSRRVSTA